MKFQELSDFSVEANTVPMVIEGKAVQVTPSDVEIINANVWADRDRLMLAASNSGNTSQEISIKIDRRVLTTYGQDGQKELTFKVFDRAGSERKEAQFSLNRDGESLVVKGTLGPDEFVLAR